VAPFLLAFSEVNALHSASSWKLVYSLAGSNQSICFCCLCYSAVYFDWFWCFLSVSLYSCM